MKSSLRRLVARMFETQVKRLIARHELVVVAVAGSVGKTSTKMAIARTLGAKYRVMVHEGNYNSEVGLPLSVFGQSVPSLLVNPFPWLWRLVRTEVMIRRNYPYDVLVLELGTDHPGEIAHFMTYLRPDVGVVTAVTPEHMENFDGLDAVAAEELALAAGSRVVLVNADDVDARYRDKYLKGHPDARTYGLEARDQYHAKITSADVALGTQVDFYTGRQHLCVNLTVNVYGEPAVKAVTAAAAVGDILGLTMEKLAEGLVRNHPVNGRMNPLAGVNDSILIDDTYNSSPDAAIAAVKALEAVSTRGRRIAVMGSMNELGTESPRYHREVGVAYAGVDFLVTVGAEANDHLGPAAVEAGLDPTRYQSAPSPYAAGEFLRLMLQPGDVVLLKGSQNGVFAEEATKLLLADSRDAIHLVRQSPDWLRRKHEQFPDNRV